MKYILLLLTLSLVSCQSSQKEAGKPMRVGMRDSIRKGMPEIQTCYSERLKEKPELKGKLVVQFVVNSKGKVKESESKVLSSALNDTAMENCVVGKISELSFPQPQNGQEAVVNYPFTFSPETK